MNLVDSRRVNVFAEDALGARHAGRKNNRAAAGKLPNKAWLIWELANACIYLTGLQSQSKL
jgi:hypothetical protein